MENKTNKSRENQINNLNIVVKILDEEYNLLVDFKHRNKIVAHPTDFSRRAEITKIQASVKVVSDYYKERIKALHQLIEENNDNRN
jgi:hypothetical protein